MRYNQFSSNNDIRKKIQDYSYGLNDIIGKGFSSVVFRGINQKTKEQVAIKVIDLKSVRDKAGKQMLQGQIEALRKLNHPNIMKCHDIFSTLNNCYIITEFCNQGDLQCLLKKKGGKLSEEEAIPIFRDIFQGFRHIAESGFLHRDLKPANILLKEKVGKIADFGFAKKITIHARDSANVGSPLYMSPESLTNNIYTIKSDIWALGVMLYEILHGKAPWQCLSEKQLIEKIKKVNITMHKNLSQEIKDFIRKCLTIQEQRRINLSQLSKHPFIVKIIEDDDLPKLLKKPTTVPENQKDIIKEKQFQFMVNQNASNGQAVCLHSIFHRKNPNNISLQGKAEKQVNAHINWMRFLYRVNDMFPSAGSSSNMNLRYTLGLRYVVVKQLFCQLECLKKALETEEDLLHVENWIQFISEKDKVYKYRQVLDDYTLKYQKLREAYQQWGKLVIRDKKLTFFVDQNFTRSEGLSTIGIFFSIEQCKNLWAQIKQEMSKIECEELPEEVNRLALRLDFLISYYQINCVLLDRFTDSDYFARNSKIELILEYKPVNLQKQNLEEIQHKMELLEILKPVK